MAKQKKNSNYVTEKTVAAKAMKEEEARKKAQSKKNTTIAIAVSAVVGVIALLFAILLVSGAFDYIPETTSHANIVFDNGTEVHIELYGKDAPETVEHFMELAEKGYFTGKTAHTLVDGLLYAGDTNADGGKNGIKGEFHSNNVNNQIPMKKGTVCMARGEGKDSAYGQFFILSGRNNDLLGEYAAFGRITDYTALEKLLDSVTADSTGKVTNAPKITKVELHGLDAHEH